MGRKEVIELCMESPLYFTMPLRLRLEFVKRHEQLFVPSGLRADILSWIRTGFLEAPDLHRGT